jgi:hypothetical protein
VTKTDVKIENVVQGDDFRVQRTYVALPTGVTIDKAWFTVKRHRALPDSEALLMKEITTTQTADGHIIDPITDNGNLGMYFELTKMETGNARPGAIYTYDVQIKSTTGAIHTLERGTIQFIRGNTGKAS